LSRTSRTLGQQIEAEVKPAGTKLAVTLPASPADSLYHQQQVGPELHGLERHVEHV
jgi:hypothetical protein